MNVRLATTGDVVALVAVQEAGAVRGLAHIFPQDTHPFPRQVIADRWLAEIADPAVEAYVWVEGDGTVTGFAATTGNELRHFGTAPLSWGTGLASQLHDAVLQTFDVDAVGPTVHLHVFEDNGRARRFYEKLGWCSTGRTRRGTFAPYPVLIEYERSLRLDHHPFSGLAP